MQQHKTASTNAAAATGAATENEALAPAGVAARFPPPGVWKALYGAAGEKVAEVRSVSYSWSVWQR